MIKNNEIANRLEETQTKCSKSIENFDAMTLKVSKMESERVQEKETFKQIMNFENSRKEQIRILIILKEKAEEETFKLKNQIKSLRKMIQILRAYKKPDLNNEKEETQNKAKEDCQKVQSELEKKLIQIQSIQKNLEDLNAQLSAKKNEINSINSKLNASETKQKESDEIIIILNEEISQIENSQAEKDLLIEGLKKQVAEQGQEQISEEQVNQMNELLTVLENELQSESQKLAEAKNIIKKHEEKIEILESNVNVNSDDSTLSGFSKEDLETLVFELETLTQSKIKLEGQNEEKESRILELEEALNLLLLEQESANKEEVILEEQKNEGRQNKEEIDVSNLTTEIEEKKAETKELSLKSEELKKQLAELEKQKNDLQISKENLKKQITENQLLTQQFEKSNLETLQEFQKLREFALSVQQGAVSANEKYRNLIDQFQKLKAVVVQRNNQQLQIDKNVGVLEQKYKQLKEMETSVLETLRRKMSKKELFEALIDQKEELISMANALRKPGVGKESIGGILEITKN